MGDVPTVTSSVLLSLGKLPTGTSISHRVVTYIHTQKHTACFCLLTDLNLVELTSLNMVGVASLNMVVDMQACSCMLEQTVHGLMNEQT